MKILDFFRRTPKNSKGTDIKAAMIKAAFSGDFVCDDVVDTISCHDATVENIPAIIFGLTRATASFLKSLENSGIAAKRQYGEMLNVWLMDVDDYDYFQKWTKEMNEHRLGLK